MAYSIMTEQIEAARELAFAENAWAVFTLFMGNTAYEARMTGFEHVDTYHRMKSVTQSEMNKMAIKHIEDGTLYYITDTDPQDYKFFGKVILVRQTGTFVHHGTETAHDILTTQRQYYEAKADRIRDIQTNRTKSTN